MQIFEPGANVHLPLGGSRASVWLRCAASPGLTSKVKSLTDFGTSEPAIRGTLVHKLVEMALTEGLDPADMLGAVVEPREELPPEPLSFEGKLPDGRRGLVVTGDIVSMAIKALDGVRALEAEFGVPPGGWKSEQRVRFEGLPYAGGTADLVGVYGSERLLVADVKTGFRHVSAEENDQLRFYAAGVMQALQMEGHTFSPDAEIVMAIIQPPSKPRVVRSTITWLRFWMQTIMYPAAEEASKAIEDGIGTYTPGKHCQYCPARVLCRVYESYLRSQVSFEEMATLTGPELAARLTFANLVKSSIPTLEALARDLMVKGESVPGYRLDTTNPQRQWKPDAEKVFEKLLGREAFELKSPAQIEAAAKKLGKFKEVKPIVDAHTYTPPGKLTIRPVGSNEPKYMEASEVVRKAGKNLLDAVKEKINAE